MEDTELLTTEQASTIDLVYNALADIEAGVPGMSGVLLVVDDEVLSIYSMNNSAEGLEEILIRTLRLLAVEANIRGAH